MAEIVGNGSDHLELRRHGRSLQLPALWLRERCSDPESLDQRSWQRLYEPAELPLDLRVMAHEDNGERLHITFSDGHRGTVAWAELEAEFAETGDARTLLLMMDNQRLLHGRTAFQQGGERHLQGCYIDHDGPDSRLRVLEAGST